MSESISLDWIGRTLLAIQADIWLVVLIVGLVLLIPAWTWLLWWSLRHKAPPPR
jgi:uncharacterized iron-regulated membrane protein